MVSIRLFLCVWLSGLVLMGCGENTPSEADFREAIIREFPRAVSDEKYDISMVINIEKDSVDAENFRSEAIGKYGDRLTGFGYARVEATTIYKKNLSKSQLRTGGNVTVLGIALHVIDNNEHWQIFDKKQLDTQQIQPSEEVLKEVEEQERQEAARREAEVARQEEERRRARVQSEIRRLDSRINQTEGRLSSSYRALEEQKRTVASICGQYPDSLNCAGRKRRQEAIEKNIAEYIAHKEGLEAERERLQGEL